MNTLEITLIRNSIKCIWVSEIFLWDKALPARNADNLTATCEPIA
jgi:hypothetical protein